MLFVDYREGSHDLVAPLQALGLPTTETELESADIAFEGRGEGGLPLQIGIEFKKLGELVGSLRTGRLQGHQLPLMRQQYNHSYLLIEGELLYGADGRLLRRAGRRQFKPMPGGMSVSEFYKRLHVLHLRGGLHPLWAHKREDTLRQIEALYRTWTDCSLDEHKSHIAIYTAPTPVPVSQFRRTVSTLPDISLQMSRGAQQRFGSLRRAFAAPVQEWAEVVSTSKDGKTRRLGMKAAQRVVDAIQKEY